MKKFLLLFITMIFNLQETLLFSEASSSESTDSLEDKKNLSSKIKNSHQSEERDIVDSFHTLKKKTKGNKLLDHLIPIKDDDNDIGNRNRSFENDEDSDENNEEEDEKKFLYNKTKLILDSQTDSAENKDQQDDFIKKLTFTKIRGEIQYNDNEKRQLHDEHKKIRDRLQKKQFYAGAKVFIPAFISENADSKENVLSNEELGEIAVDSDHGEMDKEEEKVTMDPQYEIEKKAGSIADLFGTNQHYKYVGEYNDFGRRFMSQYPYIEVKSKRKNDDLDEELKDSQILKSQIEVNDVIPIKAPPELVLAVAKQSANIEAAKPMNASDEDIRKDILRTGNYWNAVWKEEVNPEILLRSNKHTKSDDLEIPLRLASIKAEIMPGSKLYKLVSELRKISPRLLYIINK